jgi:hypothetical protein
VANGGSSSHPDEPRHQKTSTMQPSLAYVDSVTGDVAERHEQPPELHKLSIHHFGVGADDTVVFGGSSVVRLGRFSRIIGRVALRGSLRRTPGPHTS